MTPYAIRNPARLAALLKEAGKKSPGGFEGLPARSRNGQDTGISRRTLYRLRAGKWPTISDATAVRLEQLVSDVLGEEGHQRLLAMMTPPGAVAVVHQYGAWAERAAAPWERPGAFWDRAPDGTFYPVIGRTARREARIKFLTRLDRTVRDDVKEYREFYTWMRQQRIDAHRQHVAVLRILEPFLAAPESGWVERSWLDMPEATRQRIIRERVQHEVWLLKERGLPQQRAEQLAAGAVGVRTRVRPPLRERTPEEAHAEHQRAIPRQAGRRG